MIFLMSQKKKKNRFQFGRNTQFVIAQETFEGKPLFDVLTNDPLFVFHPMNRYQLFFFFFEFIFFFFSFQFFFFFF